MVISVKAIPKLGADLSTFSVGLGFRLAPLTEEDIEPAIVV
jgi:hypothetical protein